MDQIAPADRKPSALAGMVGANTVWAAISAFFRMAAQGWAAVQGIPPTLIFPEFGVMVAISFVTSPMMVLLSIAPKRHRFTPESH